MSRTIEVARNRQLEEHAESLTEEQAILWSEVMVALGYPVSWSEEVVGRLASEGKAFSWKKRLDASGG